jgi:hypothetical protein
MKLDIITIVLDGFPQITWHLPQLNRLRDVDWTWHIVEGVARNVHCTSWCQPFPGRLSIDGTREYIDEIAANHPRVRTYRRPIWDGKVEMVNTPLEYILHPTALLQMDVDECWTAEQLYRMAGLGSLAKLKAMFYCRYFVGQNIVTTTKDAYGNKAGEWVRLWHYEPGDRFMTHEPPELVQGGKILPFSHLRDATKYLGLVFDHYAYAFGAQVKFKEQYYGYKEAHSHWTRLQRNLTWPVRLKEFLPWVDARATADILR